ncbi:MAG: hypothetical protein O3B47_05110 [bacterium]|nr:hypothetical protein [bacterium]
MHHFTHHAAPKGFKMWQLIVAFIAGAAVVSAAFFAPTFGRKGFLSEDIVECGNDDMCIINAKLDALLKHFGLYSNAYGAFTSFTGQWTPFTGYWSTFTGSWSEFTGQFTGDWSNFTGDWSNFSGDEMAGEFLGYDEYEEESEEESAEEEGDDGSDFNKVPRGTPLPSPTPYKFSF